MDSSLYRYVSRRGKKFIFFPTSSCSLFVAATDCFDCCRKHRPSQWRSPETDRRERDGREIPSKTSAAPQSWKCVWLRSLTSQDVSEHKPGLPGVVERKIQGDDLSREVFSVN